MQNASIRGALAATILAGAASAQQALEPDPKLPEYVKVDGVTGTIKSVGSDTMNNLVTLWGEGFRAIYPNVLIEVEGKGSSTAPPKLIEGASNFAPMSREMKSDEIDAFEKQYGYKPTELRTSIDMLAVYVNKDNPLQGLSLQQVDAIFSQTRKGGLASDITQWGQLGLSGDWEKQPISLYGRNSASGTYGYFKERALFKGDFKPSVKEQPGSSTVVSGLATDRYGVGYSGIGYSTADVRALPLAAKEGGKFVPPTPENAYSGDYPLARYLLVYVNHQPNSELDPLRREFIRYIFSRQGQLDVIKSGYYPVPAQIAAKSLASVGLEAAPREAGMKR